MAYNRPGLRKQLEMNMEDYYHKNRPLAKQVYVFFISFLPSRFDVDTDKSAPPPPPAVGDHALRPTPFFNAFVLMVELLLLL